MHGCALLRIFVAVPNRPRAVWERSETVPVQFGNVQVFPNRPRAVSEHSETVPVQFGRLFRNRPRTVWEPQRV